MRAPVLRHQWKLSRVQNPGLGCVSLLAPRSNSRPACLRPQSCSTWLIFSSFDWHCSLLLVQLTGDPASFFCLLPKSIHPRLRHKGSMLGIYRDITGKNLLLFAQRERGWKDIELWASRCDFRLQPWSDRSVLLLLRRGTYIAIGYARSNRRCVDRGPTYDDWWL